MATRRIRSAGRTSGSIEVTLPAELQILEGLDCRLTLRDGPLPEIVLQPDVSAARSLFQRLWQKLCLGLAEIDELGEFSQAEFALALFPPGHWQERPPLAYSDALAVLQNGRTPAGKLHELARLLAGLSVVAAHHLGLSGSLAVAFGDAVAYLMTGTAAGLGTDFERGMAHRAFWGHQNPELPGSPLDDQTWRNARPGLRRVYDQFHAWQVHADQYRSAREKWFRALTMEMGGRTIHTEQNLDDSEERRQRWPLQQNLYPIQS